MDYPPNYLYQSFNSRPAVLFSRKFLGHLSQSVTKGAIERIQFVSTSKWNEKEKT